MNAIGRLRGAVRGHVYPADAAIATAVFAATAVTAFGGHGGDVAADATAVVWAALGCGALAVRRRHPLVVLAVSAAAAEVFLVATGGTRGVLILLAPLIALYTVADLVERRLGLLLGGGALFALAVLHIVTKPALVGPQNLAFVALGGLAIAAGDATRNRRAYLAEVERRAARAELDREEDARRRVAAERLRIARDLHDAVGHQLALISVQSSVAGQAIDADAAAARAALACVKDASRKALGDLRDTISLLRQPGDPVAPTAIPAPGLDGLDELLAALRASGLEIDRRVEGHVVPLAPAADLTAYRVIQESLTNVYKHSRRRRARLTLAYRGPELHITVDDLAGHDLPHEPAGGGDPPDAAGGAPAPARVPAAGGPAGRDLPRDDLPGADLAPEPAGRGPVGGDRTDDHVAGGPADGGPDGRPPPAGGGSGPDGRGLGSRPGTGGGHGIVGMRERVLALGGRFTAGPRPGGAFQVAVTLPVHAAGIAPERTA